jgi:hypothetical protein
MQDSENIIELLKSQYPRDVRKQLVKSIINSEKDNNKDSLSKQYMIINQIFSYVLKECNWSMPTNSQSLDNKALQIMIEVFPKIDNTKWFSEQLLMTKQNIGLMVEDKE